MPLRANEDHCLANAMEPILEQHAEDVSESTSGTKWSGLVGATHSLQWKATVLVVVVTLSVTAAVSGYLVRASLWITHKQHLDHLVEVAGVLSKAAAPLMESGDQAALQALATGVVTGTTMEYAVFTDAGGDLLAAEGQAVPVANHGPAVRDEGTSETPLTGRPIRRLADDDRAVYFDVTYPINAGVGGDEQATGQALELLGYVRAGVLANRWHRSMLNKLDLLVGVGSIALVIAIPFGFLVIRRIVSPLEELERAMLRFSRGKLDVRSGVTRRDEIGRLAQAFNKMADQHQHTHERIVRMNSELEGRVADRTRQLRELAAREPLTGLYNRRHFQEVLDRSVSEAIRYENELSCIMIDLDYFKKVNDRFGHQTGDKLLVLTARTITGQLRAADVAARYGGDEFVVLLPHAGPKQASVIARRMVESFASNTRQSMPNLGATISVGVGSFRSGGVVDGESLIRAADRAMYQAKAKGQNMVVTDHEADAPQADGHPAEARAIS